MIGSSVDIGRRRGRPKHQHPPPPRETQTLDANDATSTDASVTPQTVDRQHMPAAPSPPLVNPRSLAQQKQNATQGRKAAIDKQTAAPMKPQDFGKAIGIDKPANVRDKIKKWQLDLEAGVVDAENAENTAAPALAPAPAPAPVLAPTPVLAPASAPSPKPQPTPKAKPLEKAILKPAGTPTKSVEVLPERPKSAKKPAHNTLEEEVLNATAPKKRVVSDSHWRNRKSPPKDGTGRPSPKPLPTAWVRPAARKQAPPAEPKEPKEPKVSTPNKPEPKPLVVLAAKEKAANARTRNRRRRRASRPNSAANSQGEEKRPGSSGSSSPKTEKGAEDFEIVRVRRRRPSGPSPRSSLSAEDAALTKKSDIANQIVVEYESTVHDEEIRPRRRRSRRKDRRVSPEESPKDPAPAGRRHSRQKSHQLDVEEAGSPRPPEPSAPDTPPTKAGNRLEAWLQTTPDPFVDADPRKRRPSKESISTLELPRKEDKSDISASSRSRDGPVEDAPERKSGSRRRTRTRRASIKVETQDLDDRPSTVLSDDTAEPQRAKASEVTSSPTLRRRGAKRSQHSPTKDRIASPPAPQSSAQDRDDISSAPSSSVDASVVDLDKISLKPRLDTLPVRRGFPTTGKRLSTIASVETFATKMQAAPPSEALGSETTDTLAGADRKEREVIASELGDQFNADSLTTLTRRNTKRSRLASTSDLISVLSMPRAGTRSIVSARSIRSNRSRLATATIGDIMNELSSDEDKYMRELRTLVDGVIPVLLSCVLSKSDSAVAAGLFSRSSKVDPSDVTKPIIDMGVSLERLKSLHRRVPRDNSDAFVSWAQSAQRIYSDYINAWRLGFEDVVISLAPADEDPFTPAKVVQGPEDAAPWDEGLPRNADGYVVNGDGERVDVAYMLKRPLVRLKYLAKTLKVRIAMTLRNQLLTTRQGINHIKPTEQAEKISTAFQDLVAAARKRSNDERGRLEDEAAANIDPTRARDPQSLAPLAGVRIDPSRCVRARDYFDMHLLHSSGQEVNCQVELLLRDNAPGTGTGGDLLICEVDATGRWLFLPPIHQARISARNGDLKGEIVVMIRGYHGDGSEWSVVFSLRSDDEQAGFEWVQMLGLQPIPPPISELKRDPSILNKARRRPISSPASSSLVSAATGSTLPQKSRTPSPHEIEVPIGEQANATSKKWGHETPGGHSKSPEISPVTTPSPDSAQVTKWTGRSHVSSPSPADARLSDRSGGRHTPTRPASYDDEDQNERTPRTINEALNMDGRGSPVTLKRTKAKRLSKNLSPSPSASPRPSRQIVVDDPEEETEQPRKLSKRRPKHPHHSTSELSQSSKAFSVWMPMSDVENSDDSDDSEISFEAPRKPQRPQAHRRASSVPSMDMPIIPKIRRTSQPTTPVKASSREEHDDIPEPPASAPTKMERNGAELDYETLVHDGDHDPPPVPPHRSASPATPVALKTSNTPVFSPPLSSTKNNKRRSSSPLKHEYEPSTATESSTESEEEASATDDQSLTSESSDGELDDDVPMPLLPVGQPEQVDDVSPPASIYTLPNGTITPSQSASNPPYREVPQSSGKASKSVATIFSWSDEGRWDSLHPNECSIVVTPGKIEVFELSSDEIIQPEGKAPLVAVELTPLVPMRKSTAIDITIRSPPTAQSRLKSGNNIMLRSRNPAECAQLYAMINHSRINNPTYIALQNARGPYGQNSWAEAMDRQNAARTNAGTSGGWLSGTLGRRSSYRKTSTRAASISAVTESSVGTMNSALKSALGRFNFNKNGRFNIRGSTLGSRSLNSFDTGSSGSGSGTNTPLNMEPGRAPGAPAGITNTKCRLYERDSFSSKWRDMGAARLTIMLPDPTTPQTAMRQGKGSPGTRDPSQEKRIVVVGKSTGETMLDVTLGESCFERVARSGIAVSVWEDVVGPNGQVGTVGAIGGVSGAKARVFMIQVCCSLRLQSLLGDWPVRIKSLMSWVDEIGTRMRVLLLFAR